eukprot:6490862-Amphidinium_carterae.1
MDAISRMDFTTKKDYRAQSRHGVPLAEWNDEKERIIKENVILQEEPPVPEESPIYPTLESTHPDEERGQNQLKEDMNYHSRSLQCILTKATKGEPHRFLQTNIRQNKCGFEAWRALHATYDQGLQAQ